MKTKTAEVGSLGTSDLDISILGLGCWMFGGKDGDYWGGHDPREEHDLITTALELGLNYFDEAEMYNDGRSEEALGRALNGRREKALVGTKIAPGNCTPGKIRVHLEASLRRLQTDYVDIYMIHWPVRDVPIKGVFEELQQLKEEGKIRVIGVSNFGVKDLTEAISTGVEIGVNQMHYNLLSRGIETEIVPLCMKHSVGIMAYMPLLQGILSGKYSTIDEIPAMRLRTRHFRPDRPNSRHGGPGAEAEVNAALAGIRAVAEEEGVPMEQIALGWVAAKPGISCVLNGARNSAQLRSNWEGVTRPLSAEVIARLDKITDPLLQLLGSNPDYWQSGADSRIR